MTPSSPAPSNLAWPLRRGGLVSRHRRELDRRSHVREHLFEARSPLVLPVRAQVASVGGQQIEGYELGRRLLRQPGDTRCRRMQAELQRVEVQTAGRGDHDFAVDDAPRRQRVEKRGVQLGKVAIERTEIAALDEHVGSAAKHEGAKPVPLGLEQ